MKSSAHPQQAIQIDQFVQSYAKYDAIGADVSMIQAWLQERGYLSSIYACETSIPKIPHCGYYHNISKQPGIVIHHFSIGADTPYHLASQQAFEVTRYHNITPWQYFDHPATIFTRNQCLKGVSQLPLVRSISNLTYTVSQFNQDELSGFGFDTGPILPVLRDYKKLLRCVLNEDLSKQFHRKPKQNLLFVGRVMPHKGHHDLFFYLSAYKKYYNPDVRLICVGGYEPHYAQVSLERLAKKLDLSLTWSYNKDSDFDSDIIMTGGVSDDDLASFYTFSDVFMCMSDHEGFCVPLVEAMHFSLPILAHSSSAVTETCGSAGILVDKTKPDLVLQALNQILTQQNLREKLVQASYQRSLDFSMERLSQVFDQNLEVILKAYRAWLP